ncbi:TPA_asm: hypothetical protein [Porphyromonas phage phage032a_KCOM2801]|uniref:Uncharacterized protein n=1 Tax=Porphyromonas phage phage032a_KCOM2801 TaxID=3154122 RepID=A0AAT9JPI9_9CAUD
MLDAVGYAPFFVGNRCFLLETGFLSSVQQIQQTCFHLLHTVFIYILDYLCVMYFCNLFCWTVGLLDEKNRHPRHQKKNFFPIGYSR